jgi:DUF971 family protein
MSMDDDSFDMMNEFSKVFFNDKTKVKTIQNAVRRCLSDLHEEGRLTRGRMGNQDARDSGMANWCYVYTLPKEIEIRDY